jgi:hypothetical protein
MSTTTSSDVIMVIRAILARFGLIVTIVADNGPPFGAEEFSNFLRSNNIQLKHSPPYHPESNGLAERAVQTCKQSLKKTLIKPLTVHQQQKYLHNFLFTYRTTPTTTTGRSPAEMVLNYQPRTLLQLMKPPPLTNPQKVSKPVQNGFTLGQKVLAKLGKQGLKIPGRILKRLGVNTYLIEVNNGQKRLAHTHQLTASHLAEHCHPSLMIESGLETTAERATDEVRSPLQAKANHEHKIASPRATEISPRGVESPLRRSNRTVKIPDRFGFA